VRIGILGGTGPAGSGLAARLASVGHEVVIGSRSALRAEEVRDQLSDQWGDKVATLSAGDNEAAAGADFVIVATPWDAAAITVAPLAVQLEDKVVLAMCNAIVRIGKEFQPLVPPRGSVAASLQALLPKSHIAAGLHHVPAKELGDLNHEVPSDVLICSDHHQATVVSSELVATIPGVRPLDAGALSNATAIEAFTAVLLQLNVRYKTRVAVRFSGLPSDGDQ
jgi:8-hydroxy-5-deazaflavin:NADPH oxidoreductase